MKTGVIASPSIASDGIQKSTMGMSAKGMDMAAFFLRDKIYNDKVLACVREYTCNAVDEHRKHAVTQPVEIAVESSSSGHVWKIRDYAKGLDDNGVRNIFGMYFESTKSGSNDSIGGFGIGSKAAHCYTDTFYINSHHNGTLTQYACILGGGASGIPVGEIYEITTEPTTETGIEISFEIKQTDVSSFINTTQRLVRYFQPDVEINFSYPDGNSGKQVITVTKPQHVLDIDGYNYSYYDPNSDVSSHHYRLFTNRLYIRMGGVIYKNVDIYPVECNGIVIVDVPIGKLSIPISRENIEDIPANNKILQSIADNFRKFYEDVRKEVKPQSFDTYLRNKNADYFDHGWFRYSARSMFPHHISSTRYLGMRDNIYGVYPDTVKNKTVVYVIASSRSSKLWHKRLSNFLSSTAAPNQYKGYFFTNPECEEKLVADTELDLSNIAFINVKSMKLPKLPANPKSPKAEKKYVVYHNHRRLGYHTAETLEEYAVEQFGDIEDDWWTTADNISQLHQRVVYLGMPQYGVSRFSTQSKTLVNELVELGWLTTECKEYKDKVKEINDEHRKRQEIERTKSEAVDYFKTTLHPNVLKNLEKKPQKINRIKELHKLITTEQSTRARIFNLIRYQRIDRKDLRKLLTLKD